MRRKAGGRVREEITNGRVDSPARWLDRVHPIRWGSADEYCDLLKRAYVAIGMMKGYEQAVFASYRIRFGAEPTPFAVDAVDSAAGCEELYQRLEVILTRSADKMEAALSALGEKNRVQAKSIRRTRSRRLPSSR